MVNFDIFEDFWADPQLRTIFRAEYESSTPSSHMWALMLFTHPNSKFYNLSPSTRKTLIEEDYLKSSLNWDAYSSTIKTINKFVLTPAERLLSSWDTKLSEREEFMSSIPYSSSTYEMLDKMMKDTYSMKKQYAEILKDFSKEKSSKTHGDIEESLSEQNLI